MTRQLAVLVAGLVLFSIVHSALAADPVRERLAARLGLGPRGYRVLYNVLALLLLAGALLGSRGPQPLVWRAEGLVRVMLFTVQGLAAIGILWTLRSFDLPIFAGLRAPASMGVPAATPPSTARAQGSPPLRSPTPGGELAATPLRTTGVYALCRHPLYFFTAVFFSTRPTMDRSGLVLALWLWLYAYVGSMFEERRLEREFGSAYRRYKLTHARLLPLGRRRG